MFIASGLAPHETKTVEKRSIREYIGRGEVYHIPIASFKEWDHKPPTLQQIHQAVSIIQASLKSSQPVVVHCMYGLGRTGTIIAGYLTTCGLPAQEAIDYIRKLRPGSVETEEQEEVIHEYECIHITLL